MSYLIEKDGERQCVKDLVGYEDWTILTEGAAAKPKDHADFDGEKWVVCPIKKGKAERAAFCNSLSREELINALMDEIEDLKADIILLKGLADD